MDTTVLPAHICGAGGARTRDQRIMRASHARKWDLTEFDDLWCQTVVIQTDTTEYTAEKCRGFRGVGETPADCVRTGEPTVCHTARPARPDPG